MALRTLVISVGARLGRDRKDVEPFADALSENWYDSVESIRDANPSDLCSLGLPRRFATELVAAAKANDAGSEEVSIEENDEADAGKGKAFGSGKGKSKGKLSDGGKITQSIPIDLEGMAGAVRGFVFRPKLLGKGGTNIFHIQDRTGVTIDLKGWDADGCLEFVLTANDTESMEIATGMCEDLINSTYELFEEARAAAHGSLQEETSELPVITRSIHAETSFKSGKSGKAKGKGGKTKSEKGGKSPGRFNEQLPVDTVGVDREFFLRSRLVGEGGRNVKHIERTSGTMISVEYDTGDGMAFSISGDSQSAVENGKSLCEDLLEHVLEEARQEAETGKRKFHDASEITGKGRNKSKGKGKGKSKGKKAKYSSYDYDDSRPIKQVRTAWNA